MIIYFKNTVRPKKIAEALHALFPLAKLHQVQDWTAKGLGYQHWHHLEHVTKTGKFAPSPYSDDLSAEEEVTRSQAFVARLQKAMQEAGVGVSDAAEYAYRSIMPLSRKLRGVPTYSRRCDGDAFFRAFHHSVAYLPGQKEWVEQCQSLAQSKYQFTDCLEENVGRKLLADCTSTYDDLDQDEYESLKNAISAAIKGGKFETKWRFSEQNEMGYNFLVQETTERIFLLNQQGRAVAAMSYSIDVSSTDDGEDPGHMLNLNIFGFWASQENNAPADILARYMDYRLRVLYSRVQAMMMCVDISDLFIVVDAFSFHPELERVMVDILKPSINNPNSGLRHATLVNLNNGYGAVL